jgi:hypothetical protein
MMLEKELAGRGLVNYPEGRQPSKRWQNEAMTNSSIKGQYSGRCSDTILLRV